MINILIADDSAFMRLAIEKMLSREAEFNVIGLCSNGEEVLEKLKTLKPDVLTLDIEMPKLNGLQVLEKIMSTNPLPVIMVSSLTKEGAEETVRALELGAIDVVAKPSSFVSLKITDIFDELSQKIRFAAKARMPRPKTEITDTEAKNVKLRFLAERIKNRAEKIAKEINLKDYKPLIKIPEAVEKFEAKEDKLAESIISKDFKPELIVIGISTGGPASLQKIVPVLPKEIPCGIVIAQHMPPGFTKALANRLNQVSNVEVKEAEEGDVIKPGRVLICPAGFQTRIKKRYVGFSIHISSDDNINYLYKPSIDVLFSSAAETYKNKTLGIIMTGMGNDGTKGCIEINEHGGKIFAQSSDSCIVDSMPTSVVKAGIVDEIYHLDLMAKSIIELFEI